MLKPFEDAILALLNVLYGFTHSYGWAIILLTILIRIVLLPLVIKQTRAHIDLQRIQPKVKELQKKYKDNKEKLNEEILKLYSEHKVNPFGGCLPLLVQLPIFWALFSVLISYKELANESFLFIPSLGLSPSAAGFSLQSWPYLLIVVLLALSTYLSSMLMTTDRIQEITTLSMTVLMLFIAWQLPAGVLVYWVTTNFLTFIQQYVQLEVERRRAGQ